MLLLSQILLFHSLVIEFKVFTLENLVFCGAMSHSVLLCLFLLSSLSGLVLQNSHLQILLENGNLVEYLLLHLIVLLLQLLPGHLVLATIRRSRIYLPI